MFLKQLLLNGKPRTIWTSILLLPKIHSMRISLFSTSYFVTDQRIQRIAMTLAEDGHSIKVYTRKHKHFVANSNSSIRLKFIRTLFKKGPLFYLTYNLKIFIKILFSRVDVIYANDLDTLLGCWMGSVLRFKPLIYDSHELFTEVPELLKRPVVKSTWHIQEVLFIKRAKSVITVSEGVSNELSRRFKVQPVVIRNLPIRKEIEAFREKQPTLIYQGSLNVGRGLELAIEMMNYLTCYRLVIVGKGDIEVKLRKQMLDSNLFDRVQFLGQLPPEKLRTITPTAWLGLSLEEDMGLSYRYALPNKLFDYIAAQVPVLVSDLPEMRKVVEDFGVGIVAQSRNPKELANQVANLFEDKKKMDSIAANLKKASEVLNWQNESPKLVEVINSLRRN